MRLAIVLSVAFWVAVFSGCSGMEVGGRLGVYRVDERQESQRTYRQAVPLKCWFSTCTETPSNGEGS